MQEKFSDKTTNGLKLSKVDAATVNMFLDDPSFLREVLDLIPKGNTIHNVPEDTQRLILNSVLNEIPSTSIVKSLIEKGFNNFSRQQLDRIKKRLLPAVMKDFLPKTIFAGQELEEQIKHIEFLVNEQYARVVERIALEDEMRNTLVPNTKVVFKDESAYEKYRDDYIRFYEGTMSEMERRAFLGLVKFRGYDSGITSDLVSIVRLFEKIILLRIKLRDKKMNLGDVEPSSEKDKIPESGLLPSDISDKISESMRKRALGLKEDGQEKQDEPKGQ